VDTPRGTHENPISWIELSNKTSMVLRNVMGPDQITDLVRWVRGVETAVSARELRPFLEAPGEAARRSH
jgi:hypothetical protein